MTLSRLSKTYYSLLFIFLTLLVASYSNLAQGGAVLWTGQNPFYIAVFLIFASLFYVIVSSRSTSFSWVEACAIGAVCLALFLVVWAGSGKPSFDFDSTIYVHSIDFTLHNGFIPSLASNSNFVIGSQYPYPMQSMLGAALVLLTGSSYMTVGEYLPLLIFLVFLVVYYALASQRFCKKAALLSLAIVASFPFFTGFSISVSNADLGAVFLLLTIFLVFLRDSGNSDVFTALAFFVIGCFVLTHHLSFVLLIVALAALVFEEQILRSRLNLNVRKGTLTSVLLVAIVAVFLYYIYVDFGPIQTIVDTFANQLGYEVSSATPVATWSAVIIAQRVVYLVFIGFSVFLSVSLARADLRRFFLSPYADFLLIGGVLFVFSVVGAFIQAPYDWDRVSVYGWIFIIPATLAMAFDRGGLPIVHKRRVMAAFCAILAAALVLANVYALPINLLNHAGAIEYTGSSYKGWVKPQEYYAAVWTIQNKTPSSQVIGDDIVRALYLANSPNFTGPYEEIGAYKNTTSANSIIVVRKENSYQIISTFWAPPGQQAIYSDNELITSLLSNQSLYRVYDNAEVQILYSPAP
jgi:hypothetical protein